MDHQDWKTVTFNTASKNKEKEDRKKINSNKANNPEETRLEAPKLLGSLISQARTAKNMKRDALALQIGVSSQILGRWETNKDVPTNAEISKIEKLTGVKLPRCKKVKAKEI